MSEISLTYGVTTVNLPFPVLPYETIIKLPFDILRMDDSTFESGYDEGTIYDKRYCNLSFLLPANDDVYNGSDIEHYATQEELTTFIYTTARAKDITASFPVSCGFVPFGYDKGDTGPFTISAEFTGTPAIQQSPLKYFKCNMSWFNSGAYPAYSLPSQINDGQWTIGTITNCRMPQNMFVPDKKYSVSVIHTESSASRYFDRGSLRESPFVKFTQQCNSSKCAALLYYLTSVIRASTFSITTQDYYYIFGADHSSSDTYTVKLATNEIKIRHLGVDNFEIDLILKAV